MNKKGFTMVELLVAMAILGLLIIMAFPTIRAVQSNNTNTKYEEYGKSVLSASKLYADSYGEDLFDASSVNEMKSIELNKLVTKDLLKDINVSGSTCLNGSSVNIIKYGDDYTYCLNLICKSGNKEVYKKISKEGKCKDLVLYKVTYKSPGQTDHVVSVVEGEKHTVLSPSAASISIPTGYGFSEWSSSIGNKKPGDVITVNTNITFTTSFNPFDYKVRYSSSLNGVAGIMTEQPCRVGEPCKLKANGYSKDYYTFNKYIYNSKEYKPGDEMKDEFNVTANNQIIEINVTFRKNNITLNYYSNGGVLSPGPAQVCPELAGCKKDECKWPQVKYCINKSGLIMGSTASFDNTNFGSLRNYNAQGGTLYLKRKGCTGTYYWFVDEAGSSKKIDERTEFKTRGDFAKQAGYDNKLKKNDVTINVFAEWDCPNSITCAAGTYLPANKTTCATCTASNYCIGGTFNKKSVDQGISPCPDCYKNSAAGSKTKKECYANVGVNKYVKEKTKCPISCGTGYEKKPAYKVYYESTSSCSLSAYTISYNLNGGSVSGNSTSYTYNTPTFTLNNPTKSGYIFKGWTGTGLSSATQTVTIKKGSTGNRSYTANWQEKSKCTITFNANGGKFNNHTSELTKIIHYGESIQLHSSGNYYDAKKDYYHISGDHEWCNGNSCFSYESGKTYTAQQLCSGLTQNGNSKTITLKVKWVPNVVRIHYCWNKARTAKKWNDSKYDTFSTTPRGTDNVCDVSYASWEYGTTKCNFRDNRGDKNQKPPQHYCIKNGKKWGDNYWVYHNSKSKKIPFDSTGNNCSSKSFKSGNSVYNKLEVDSQLKTNTIVDKYVYVRGYQSSNKGC